MHIRLRRQCVCTLVCLVGWLISRTAVGQALPLPDLRAEVLLDDVDVEVLLTEMGADYEIAAQIQSIIGGFTAWSDAMRTDVSATAAAIRERQERIQESIARSQAGPDANLAEEWEASKEAWKVLRARAISGTEEIARRQDQAVMEIKTHLTAEQQFRFDVALRDLRRAQTIGWGAKFPAERVDVAALLLNRELVSEEEAQGLLEAMYRYGEDLDPLLRERNALVRAEPVAAEADALPTPLEQMFNERQISRREFMARIDENSRQRVDRRIDRLRPVMAVHWRIGAMNRAVYEQYRDSLSSESRARVEPAFWRMAYADDAVESKLPTDTLIERVLQLDTLSEQQYADLISIRDSHWWPVRREIEAELRRNADERAMAWEAIERGEADHLSARRTELWRRRADLQQECRMMILDTLDDTQKSLIGAHGSK